MCAPMNGGYPARAMPRCPASGCAKLAAGRINKLGERTTLYCQDERRLPVLADAPRAADALAHFDPGLVLSEGSVAGGC